MMFKVTPSGLEASATIYLAAAVPDRHGNRALSANSTRSFLADLKRLYHLHYRFV